MKIILLTGLIKREKVQNKRIQLAEPINGILQAVKIYSTPKMWGAVYSYPQSVFAAVLFLVLLILLILALLVLTLLILSLLVLFVLLILVTHNSPPKIEVIEYER